ncbi:hypothetical protein, conserved [Thermococcus kodakarensis KOD1]|uniref:Uncharacterized protein n=1 Tax=Thermococcus kodakarensis (strain ATCC BAA-918 / JCM 12380 / KOD1) TaxID=69014 RepID=Q5JD78_THEKO|nr:hypothetical protein [Thermococcus kodakarensis]WCN28549.1 hypothetical protein POG15_02510 [Thermococcus kodakarensis]WCN30846.1 hypothetical protein POG21_02510 [Thermococcus kodakarensis]BAD84679.1 hypothetical protein, conserved [Thermococcus kodakarensis KOD1]
MSWWLGSLKPMRLVGKHIEIDVDPNAPTCFPSPIPTLMRIDRRLIIGGIFKSSGCTPLMMDTNLHGMFQDLLDLCISFLDPDFDEQGEMAYPRREARKLGFKIGDSTKLYQTSLFVDQGVTTVFFELVGERLRIHYLNELLGWSDCEDARKTHRGTFEVPFLEFAEDVLVLSRRFLTEVAPIIEEVCPELDDPEYLWKLYLELNARLVGEDD